ncbi:MAG: (Fe-S)-binding protein, partial [Geobacter sp.]
MSSQIIFPLLLIVALIAFCVTCYKRFSLVRLGRAEDRFQRPCSRFRDMLLYAFGQKRVMEKPFGINHLVIFWSFMILLVANGEFLLRGVFPAVSLALLPQSLYHGLMFIFDILSLLTLVSIAIALGRRLFFPPSYLNTQYVSARSFEAFLILGFISLLMLAYFGLHGAEIAMGKEAAAAYMPVSSFVGSLLSSATASLELFALICWWVHAAVLLAFIVFLPHSKHMHILAAIPNCFFRNMEKPVLLPREEFVTGNSYGVSQVDQFTWKDLFDSYSCTECGRCQDACPASLTGKSLNPRQVIHAIKTNLLANGELLEKGEQPTVPLIGAEGEGTNTEETIWACTTCGACMEVCPVLIEQMPKIIKMR